MEETAEKTKKDEKTQQVGSFYDLHILLLPTITDSGISAIEENIKNIIEKNSGNIEKINKFVKKELAYPMKKMNNVYAGSFYFWVDPSQISNIQTEVKELEQDVLRFMITRTTPQIFKAKKITQEAVDKIEKELEAHVKDAVGTTSPLEKINTEKTREEKSRVTMDDIDKKLDEIMGTL